MVSVSSMVTFGEAPAKNENSVDQPHASLRKKIIQTKGLIALLSAGGHGDTRAICEFEAINLMVNRKSQSEITIQLP